MGEPIQAGRRSGGFEDASAEEGHALVFAIAHEVGNHLGGIRLHADLLGDEADVRGLAESSVVIDGLAARAAPLLALLRPILEPVPAPSHAVSWDGLLAAIRQQLLDEGTKGVRVELESPGPEAGSTPAVPGLQSLLLALIGATLEPLAAGDSVTLRLERRASGSALILEDGGPEEDLSTGAALRGRALAVAIARRLVARVGGRVEVGRGSDRTRIEMVWPRSDAG